MNKHNHLFRSLGFAALGSMLMISSVTAQQAQNAPAAASLVPDGWFKVCNIQPKSKKKICAMNLQLRNEAGNPLASIRVVELEGVTQKGFTIVVPPGLLIQPGMRIQIDGTKKGTAKFQICSAKACFVETRFNNDFIGSMKRGNEMTIIGLGQDGKQIEFKATLAGFTAAYDGPPIDPKAIASSRENLQQRLQRKADEARKRLLEEQKNDSEGTNGSAPAQSN